MNSVLYDVQTKDIILLTDFDYDKPPAGIKGLHNPNPSKSVLFIDIKYLSWIEDFVNSTNLRLNFAVDNILFKRSLYICNSKDFTLKLMGCFISSYSIEDDTIRVVIESDYHIVDDKVDNQFKQLYREKVLSDLGI